MSERERILALFQLEGAQSIPGAANLVVASVILELTKKIPLLQNSNQGAPMARLSINSEPVQTLITGKVIPLLLSSGNVASLTKALNDAAQSAGLDGRLHANRIHALLSMDVDFHANLTHHFHLDLTHPGS